MKENNWNRVAVFIFLLMTCSHIFFGSDRIYPQDNPLRQGWLNRNCCADLDENELPRKCRRHANDPKCCICSCCCHCLSDLTDQCVEGGGCLAGGLLCKVEYPYTFDHVDIMTFATIENRIRQKIDISILLIMLGLVNAEVANVGVCGVFSGTVDKFGCCACLDPSMSLFSLMISGIGLSALVCNKYQLSRYQKGMAWSIQRNKDVAICQENQNRIDELMYHGLKCSYLCQEVNALTKSQSMV